MAGDAAEVSSITKPGAEIHEYQPTPGDINAQGHNWFSPMVWIWNCGSNALPASQRGSRSNCLFGCDACRDHRRTLWEANLTPHAWMSPDNALIYVDNIRDALIKYDPANAQTYQRNADTYKPRLPKPCPCVSRLRNSWESAMDGHQWRGFFLSRTRWG